MQSTIHAIALRLLSGEDLKAKLDAFVAEHKIKAACVITCVGSLQQAAIRFANRQQADILTGKFEIISLTGTLGQAASHLHIAISDSAGKMIGGHLKEGSLIYTTAEIVIGLLPEVIFDRVTDATYGFKELAVTPLTN
jgi:predicted DNA-binding protein with PD1-like motif